MRILQVCAVDFTAYHLLGALLRRTRERGHAAEFACADGPLARALELEGFTFRPVPMSRSFAPGAQLAAIAQMARSLWRDPPDIVHTHTPIGGLVGRGAALLTFRGPVAHTFHGLPFEREPDGLRERAFLIAERVVAKRTRLFFSQARGDVARAAALGIAEVNRTTVIGNGVDTRRFAPDPVLRVTTRAALGIPDHAVVVTIVARLVREKGLLDLADAALALAPDPRLHFIVVGRALPSDRSSVEPALNAHPVRKALGTRWRLLGMRADVAELLIASDLFVLPSLREGLPRSVIEAMACGLPVVATAIPACMELVRDGDTGRLVPVSDSAALAVAINSLASDDERRVQMGKRAREIALANHDETRIVDVQLDALLALVER